MSSILQSIPSSMKIRDELEQMVLNDLLGPVGGQDEEIDEPSVRDRYLVGMLAPKRQELSPEEFDELPQGGSGAVEDGSTEVHCAHDEDDVPVILRHDVLPGPGRQGTASHRPVGLLSSGAQRDPDDAHRRQEAGLEAMPARRASRSRSRSRRAGLNVDAGRGIPGSRGAGNLLRKRDHFWSVTLFLVNGQEEPKKLRDTAWLFQPELSVQSPDGKPIFHSRPQQRDLGKSDPVTFAEEQEMAMLYRHQVEFGVGHGVSIHADCPEGVCDRAVPLSHQGGADLRSSRKPRRRRTPIWPKLAGLVLDMKELGETPTAELDKKLRPLLVRRMQPGSRTGKRT